MTDHLPDAGKMMPKALELAELLEDTESARLHLLPYVAAELRHLHQHELAHKEWLDKTEWVQETCEAYELGMHRADALKRRIDRLVSTLAETHGAHQAKLLHDEALLSQAVNDLHMILGGYGKLLHENDRIRLKATAQKIEDCLK